VSGKTRTGGEAVAQKEKTPPRIPFLSDAVFTLPLLGEIKGYYILLILLFFAYLITKSGIVGLGAGALIVFIVVWEFYSGVKTHGFGKEAKETLIALGIALLLWFGAGWLLNTPVPINAIVSCSMLPSYERGDMVLLQGSAPKAPVIDYDGSIGDINSNAHVQYRSHPNAKYPDSNIEVKGSIFAYCAKEGAGSGVCSDFASNPGDFAEYHGPLKINYGHCTRVWPKSGQERAAICVKSAELSGRKIDFDYTNDLVVYAPKKNDLYSLVGDIVHRVAFGIRTPDGQVNYFTKGDNNPIFDFQAYEARYNAGNSPVDASQIKGKVIARIPYIGNFKMFITPPVLFSSGAESGCDSHFKN